MADVTLPTIDANAVNASIYRKPVVYARGLQVSKLTTEHDASNLKFKVTKGSCSDSQNIDDIILLDETIVDLSKVGKNGIDVGETCIATVTVTTKGTKYTVGDLLSLNGGIGGVLEVLTISGDGTIETVMVRQPGVSYTAAKHGCTNLKVANEAAAGAEFTITIGNLAQSRPYYAFVIASSSSPSTYPTACICSASNSQPVMPFGYDLFRCVGIVKTTAANPPILAFTWTEGKDQKRTVFHNTPVKVVTAGKSQDYIGIDLSGVVAGIESPVLVNFLADLKGGADAAATLFIETHGLNSTVPSFTMHGQNPFSSEVTCPAEVDSNGFVAVDYKITGAGETNIYVVSYEITI